MTATRTRTAAPESSGLLARPGGAGAGSSSPSAHPLAAAQSALGNALVQRQLREGAIQASMAVTATDDDYEREADSVAARIMRMEAPGAIGGLRGPGVQRQAAAPTQDERKKPEKTATPATAAAQEIAKPPPTASAAEPKKKDEETPPIARSAATPGVPTVTPAVETGVQAARGAGAPLPQGARSFLEPRFGRDFSAVRIHADGQAAGLARSLDADAFTTGRDVFFAAGRYQPHTAEGRRLLAHELTHTVQQGAAGGLVQRQGGGGGAGGGGAGGGGAGAGGDDEGSGGTYEGPGLPGSGASQPLTGTEGNLDIETPPAWFPLPGAKLPNAKTLRFPTVNIPGFKRTSAPQGSDLWGTGRGTYAKVAPLTRADTQISVWRDEVALQNGEPTSEWMTELGKLLNPGVSGPPFAVPPVPNVIFELRKAGAAPSADPDWQGQPRNLARGLAIPDFNSAGAAMAFEVDHIRELQLADYDNTPTHWSEHPPNFWLLESVINRESGRGIQAAISKRVRLFRDRIREYYRLRADAAQAPGAAAKALTDMVAAFGAANAELADVRSTIAAWRLEFAAASPNIGDASVGEDKFWSAEKIRKGEHLRQLRAQLQGVPDGHIRVLTSSGSAGPGTATPGAPAAPPPALSARAVDFEIGSAPPSDRERSAFKPFRVASKARLSGTATGTSLGFLDIDLPGNSKFEFAPGGGAPELEVKTATGLRTGVVEQTQVFALFSRLRYKGASPITVDTLEVDPGVGVRLHGRIQADAPLLREGIDFEVTGDELRVYKEFGIGALNVPAPFHIYSSSLTLSAGTRSGLMVAGLIEFGIDRVGVGSIGASAGTATGFALDGEFNFDSKLFQPARVAIHFHENRWSGEGDLGITEGKVQGIRSATVHVGYTEGHLEATGNAQLTIPGIQRAGLTIVLDEATGMTVAGDVELANNIPGIRSGRGHAEVHQPAEGGDYRVAITGEAQPAIPGIDSTISFAYDDGALTIAGQAAYSRGIASGTVDVGATNRPLDASGQPVPGGTPGDALHAYGGGSLTLQLAPWLQGTIGVRLLPSGELEITGSVGLPAAINLFEARDLNRPIFHTPPIDIPIVGVAVAGARVGIFATLSGGLDLSAGIGPGQLRELGLTVTYNPDHEDQTHVVGDTQLHIPAHAGLRLFIRGGLGVGIPLVSATANLEVSGQLGLEGALDSDVHVDWTPGTGLVIDASASLYAEPKFRFAVDGTVLVEAGIGFLTATLYEKRWNLAAFEYGSGLRLGMRFPFHYQEGQAFQLSWDDVQYEIPDIEPRQVLTGLLEQIT